MGAGRRVNEHHPKYGEYKKKFKALREKAIKEREDWEKENPDFQGLDGEPMRIDKRLAQSIKQLQEEYSFLFEDKE